MKLELGDVVLCRGPGILSAAIRLGSTEPGERRTVVNHCGIISRGGPVNKAMLIESLPRGTVERPLRAYRTAGADSVVIYRLQTITDDQMAAVAHVARSHVGRRYGWLWVVAHAVDWLIGSRWYFRGLVPVGNNPVCSGVVATAYAAIGYRFRAIEPAAIQPDDIWDDVTNNVPPWVPVGCL